MATNTTLIGSIAGSAVLVASVIVGVLTAPAPAPATGALTEEQTQAWSELEGIQQTLAGAREARQELVRAKARVADARAELQAAQAELTALEAAWPETRAQAMQARARWIEVRKTPMPEALRGSQWAGMDRVVREPLEDTTP